MKRSEQVLRVQAVDRSFSVVPHILIWDHGRGRNRELLFASYVGVPEEVKAVTASILEGREVTYNQRPYARNIMDAYRRVEKEIGNDGRLAHGVVYNSLFEIAETQQDSEEEKNNRAFIFAPDGDLHGAIVQHAMSRFGLPEEWRKDYIRILDDFFTSLQVEINPELPEWQNAKAAFFYGTEEKILNALSDALQEGRLRIPESPIEGVFDPTWSMSEYLRNNASQLAKQLEAKQPRHTFDDRVDPAIADLKRIPFPVQAHMAQAIVNTFENEEVFCGGDMGSGKSIIACAVSHVLHSRKRRRNANHQGMPVLLSAPGITLPKWKAKEIEGTIPGAKVNIIRSGNEALQLLKKVRSGYRPAGLEFTLVGIDRAKLGSETYFGGIWKPIYGEKEHGEPVYAWHCGDCGQPIMVYLDGKGKGDKVPATWNVFAEGFAPFPDAIREAKAKRELLPNGIPKDFPIKWVRKAGLLTRCDNVVSLVGCRTDDGMDEKQRKAALKERQLNFPDRECGNCFYRPALKSRGETKNKPRVNISQVLKRTKRYFDLYICDEAHQCKAGDSGRGDAFAQMVKAARRTLMLTGTPTNGKSTSIKELLWRTDPKSLIDAGITFDSGDVDWAKRYGKIEEIIHDNEGDEGVVTRRKKKSVTTKEAPGIAPQLTAQFLLHKAAFIELPDMGLPLVELKEIPVFLDMDEEHRARYSAFHNHLYDVCAQASAVSGNAGVWSKFNPATLVYADRPDLGMSVTVGEETVFAEPIGDGSELHAKERWLVETVKQEIAEGRRVTIYNSYTGRYGMNERLRDILSRNGIRCQILDEPNTELRSERIAEYEEAGIPVIICNQKLVEVGLDLLFWPTIIFYQMSYEVSTVRQSSRRAWRIGQDMLCKVYYPVYQGSQAMKQFIHIMNGRGHALQTEGRIDKSELAQYSRDSQSSLARDLASCFASADVAQAWQKIAAKELEGVEMIAEANFKDVLKQRMKELADATIRLCGLDPEVWRAAREKEQQEEEQVLAPAATYQSEDAVMDVDVEVLDLFDIFGTKTAETVITEVATPKQKQEVETIQLLTFAELAAASGKKKVKRPAKFMENQLLLSLG
ncbi:helicase-related protein [Paenibacillus allorhizosphaerae]|uniref:Helicase ATP-binding domain-containing protein n=1 Tax=Paenibacillus allorhizosphaerae TaxID=2849866 RepID=A0ABM8VNF0_9BACL|nr:DEAD/DEAH box helicase [Paenibacillus allorhizosphaerae]CAG7651366.1 hypothetical protein PAECIP111802_04945 [Paenibacillus allorhizosphaerae]